MILFCLRSLFCSVLFLLLCPLSPAQENKDAPADMVLIPGGAITLGIDSADIPHFQSVFQINRAELFTNSVPKHIVKLEPFYLDKYLVTNAQFLEYVQTTHLFPSKVLPSLRNGNYLKHWTSDQVPKDLENHPIVNIGWSDAFAYCRWRGKRLPLEAEWVRAARGGLNGLFPWGDAPADPSRANFSDSAIGTTTEVGKYPPNGYGLYDMAGNVWQFTRDVWAPYHSQTITQSNADHLLESEIFTNGASPRRVIRGGSFGGAPINMWIEYRDSHPPDNAQPFVSFRCAKSAK